MGPRTLSPLLVLSILAALLSPASVVGTDFNIFDSTVQVDNPFIEGTMTPPVMLAPGDTITFQGDISVTGFGPAGAAVVIDPLVSGLTLTFQDGSTTTSADSVGVGLAGNFDGLFENSGAIFGGLSGVVFDGNLDGVFRNMGTVRSNPSAGFGALAISNNLNGSVFNTGLIEAIDGFAVDIAGDVFGVFENSGTIRTRGPGPAIAVLMRGNVEASGIFRNSGLIEGFAEGVLTGGDFSGMAFNTGTITGGVIDGGTPSDGFQVEGRFLGFFQNDGTILAGDDGVDIDLNAGLGSMIINNGLIEGQEDGVDFDRNLNGTLINNGTIRGLDPGDGDGIDIDRDLGTQGSIVNTGLVYGAIDGVYVDRDVNGSVTNSGTLMGVAATGFTADRDFTGNLVNTGVIRGGDIGFFVRDTFSGTLLNDCGIIEGTLLAGIRTNTNTGIIRNHGGRISGPNFSIRLGTGDGTVVLSGPSHLQGRIGGGGGNDTVRFENMRGINTAKQAELAALAAADPTTGAVVLFGETIAWQTVEDIQADAASLVSYESLISGAGLNQYAVALDNVTGLEDSFREFLKGLNDLDASLLNAAVANTSGQNLQNALRDIARHQDTHFFHLFSNQFSSLRGDVSGQLVSNQGAVQNTGLFTQEVQVGMAVVDPEESSNLWVTSYFGTAEQDNNGTRATADYDNTSVLFGSGTDIGNGWYLGGFGGYSRNDGPIDGFGSTLENEGGWFGVNAQYRTGDVFATVVGALGLQDYASVRRDPFGNVLRGDTESFGGFIYGQAGRDYYLGGGDGGARVTPYLGMTLSSQSVDAFTERGSAGAALRFSDETITEFQTVLGVSVAGYRSLPNGWIRPRADLAWWHAFSGSSSYSAGLGAPGLLPGFAVATSSANDDRAVLQVGFEFGSDKLDGWTFEAGYFGVLGSDDYESHGGTFGARLDF